MARASKLKVVKDLTNLGSKKQPRDVAVLPENTQRGVKARVPINLPGIKTR